MRMLKPGTFLVIFKLLTLTQAFPWLAEENNFDLPTTVVASNSASAATAPSQAPSLPVYTWSASLLIDVNGAHAREDPQPG